MATTILSTVYPLSSFDPEVTGAPVIVYGGVAVDDTKVAAVYAAAAANGVTLVTLGVGGTAGTSSAVNVPVQAAGPYKRWTDLPEPWIVPHRGAGPHIAPDNTAEAMQIGVGMGFGVVDGGDYRLSTDGALLNMHDRNMPMTTLHDSGTNTDDLSSIAWQNVTIDAGRWFGTGWGNLKPMTARETFARFGQQALLTPEPKEDVAGSATALIQAIVNAGLQERVLFTSFTLSSCQAAIAAGIPNTCLNLTIPSSAASVISQIAGTGVKYVCVDKSTSTSILSGIAAAGIKVTVYSPYYQSDKAALDAAGVVGYWSENPVYFSKQTSKYRRSVAPWVKSGTAYHGHLSYFSVGYTGDVARGTFVGPPGAYRWKPDTSNTVPMLQGWACPLPNATGTYSLTVPIVWDLVTSDATRWVGVYFGVTVDNDPRSGDEFSGYCAMHRVDGSLRLWTPLTYGAATTNIGTNKATGTVPQPLVLSAGLTSGVAVTSLPVNAVPAIIQAGTQFLLPTGQLVTTSSSTAASATSVAINSVTPTAAVASGTSIPVQTILKVDVTPTTIALSRTDTGASSNTTSVTTDSLWRGEYMYLRRNGATDLAVSFGAITVS